MGYAVGSKCVGTVQQAATEACGSYPRTSASGSTLVTWSCTGVAADGSSLALTRTDTDGGTASQTVALSFAPCDEGQQVADVVEVWGAGLAALAAIWGIKRLVYRLVANQ